MKKHLLISLIFIAIAMTLGVVGFFVYTLVLRTDYKETALVINESFRTKSTVTVRKGNESFSLPESYVEYYNMFLLDGNTVVFSRKAVPATEKTIILDFGKEQLSFTGLEDGTAIAVSWVTPTDEKHYIVRSKTTFMQLSAYYKNCQRKAENE